MGLCDAFRCLYKYLAALEYLSHQKEPVVGYDNDLG
jgi:hypothetical protein